MQYVMQLSPEGKELVENALTDKLWNESILAENSDIGIATVKKFRAQRRVSRNTFVTLCRLLEINWQDAAVKKDDSDEFYSENFAKSLRSDKTYNSEVSKEKPLNKPYFDESKVRERCRQKIINHHSQMQLLSGDRISVDSLYVDVWLLENPENEYYNSPLNLLKNFNIEQDRLALSKRINRNPGFEVANLSPKLVILGKPGSGKTTFIKHLAVDWCNYKFQKQKILVLIELRQIRDDKWNIIHEISNVLGFKDSDYFLRIKEEIQENIKDKFSVEYEIFNIKKEINQENNSLKKQKKHEKLSELQLKLHKVIERIKINNQNLNSLPLQYLLEQGKILLLLDGLDEIWSNKLRQEVQKQLDKMSEEYQNNRFILTCRTQVINSFPKEFDFVEVAEFSSIQVEQFIKNWFKVAGFSEVQIKDKWENIYFTIANHPELKELTMTPVLLSLICLIVQHDGEIPSERIWLYKKGIKLMLSKWNMKKKIADWEVGTERYQKLNIEDKEALLMEIAASKFQYPSKSNFVLYEQDELAEIINYHLQLNDPREGELVLKAIESQHGLLIERADELWSFSHLTFQEHFTVQWLIQISSERLVTLIADDNWQKIMRQLVKSQQPAERLLWLIKQAIDKSFISESKVQVFLNWIFKKSKSIKFNIKTVAVRAIYYSVAINYMVPQKSMHAQDILRKYEQKLIYNLQSYYNSFANHGFQEEGSFFENNLILSYNLFLQLIDDGKHFNTDNLKSNFIFELQQLVSLSPASPSWRSFREWYKVYGSQWLRELYQDESNLSNMEKDWQLTYEQKYKLIRYYNANEFLVELINIKGAVSDNILSEIEDSLLLPWKELQRRYPNIYSVLE